MKVYELRMYPDVAGSVFGDDELGNLLEDIRNSEPGDGWTVLVGEMDREKYENLPEFEGW